MRPVACAAFILASAFVAFGREIPRDFDSRIIGGHDAPDGKFPYDVSLRVYFQHFCGGSILNHRWVMTAAHCIISKRADEVSVVAGTNHLSESGQMYQATLIVAHPYYDASKIINDIGLIRVSREIEYTEKIQPVRLPTHDFDKINYPALLSGWGTTSLGGQLAELLQEIELLVISHKVCAAKEPLVIHSHICTLTKAGEGACHGDSGSPLIADGVQIGIASFGNPCAKGHPDVHTRVWSFLRWIEITIIENNED